MAILQQAERARRPSLCQEKGITETPFYGIPRITTRLRPQGHKANHERIERLMERMFI